MKTWNENLRNGLKNRDSGDIGRPPMLDSISIAAVKARLKEAEDDHSRPLDDQGVVDLIREQKIMSSKRKLLFPDSRV